MTNVKPVSPAVIREAADILHRGGTVVVPTDTNYNVVTSPYSRAGVDRIFDMKKREAMSPLTLFLGDSMELPQYAYTTPQTEFLAKRLWPEKISFILWQRPTVPSYVTRGFGTVALTLHRNAIHREIAHLIGTPLAGTSANLSGTGNVPLVQKAIDHLGDNVDLIIDAGSSDVDGANTIVDFTFGKPMVARAGAFPVDALVPLIPDLVTTIDNKDYKQLAKERALQQQAIEAQPA